MTDRVHIWMPCFDDLGQLEAALASTADFDDVVDVTVVDGRYASFDGDHDLTPGAEEACDAYDHVTYTHPPELPIGRDTERGALLRSPQHEQAKWVNYEVLPQEEWALEMDTDERLEHVDVDAIADLDPRRKYTPQVLTPNGDQLKPAIRLYQPGYWTFWIDDVMFWRSFYPRDTPLEELFEAHVYSVHRNTGYAGETGAIRIRNLGAERPQDYRNRRGDQLEAMGAKWAGHAMRDGEHPSLLDLNKYRELYDDISVQGGEQR